MHSPLLFTILSFPTSSKLQAGLAAIEKNTGAIHPAVTGFKGTFTATSNNPVPEKLTATLKRATAAEPLTDFEEDLWFGTITVGTPPQTLTGETRLSFHFQLEN
jgi:hypothetical protein